MSEPVGSYKEELTRAMNLLASDPAARFIGYGVRTGRAMGTLKDVAESQLVETPVAENLMMGMAIGMALGGLKPLVFIERCDFLLNAADALVNHLDKLPIISRGDFQPKVIVRVVVGNKTKGLQTGATHIQDFSEPFEKMCQTVAMMKPLTASAVRIAYDRAVSMEGSSLIFEYKDYL